MKGVGLAVITGASSGIGRELARIHAALGGQLILAARRLDALEALRVELSAAHSVSVTIVQADLSTADGIDALCAACEGIQVDVLINNAGFGALGRFDQQDVARSLQMIDLNVRSLTELTHRLVAPMVARGSGRILNVGSTAGLVPGPLQAVYYASKAYVNSFSQALAEELRGTGVSVTVLAPGPVATEFMQVASMDKLSVVRHSPPADKVARIGYDAMMQGRLLVIDDWRLGLIARVISLAPRRLVVRASRRLLERKTRA